MVSFGVNLKMLRTAKKISQGELATMVGMHSTHISRYERDLTQPTLDVIKKIASALGVSTDILIYGSQEEQARENLQDSELLRMFARVQSLNKTDVSCIKNMLNAYILKTDLQEKLAL